MVRKIKQIITFFSDGVWQIDPMTQRPLVRAEIGLTRIVLSALRGFTRHACALHAAGLTYFSLLAIVPILCLSLLLAKTLGAGDFARREINTRLDALITNVEKGQDETPAFLAGLSPEKAAERKRAALAFGSQARDLSNALFDRIDKFQTGTLGWLGLTMLVWTVISTLGMVEASFNEIWEVEKQRPLWKRCCLYVLISLVLPLPATAALSLPVLRVVKRVVETLLGATAWTKEAGNFLLWVLESPAFTFCFTLLFASLAFAFFLAFMPNRRVRFRPALAGGLITALLSAGWLKLCAIAQVGIAGAGALYGSFALGPIVLAWIYMSWQIVLLGSNLTYAIQTVHCRSADECSR